MEDEGYHGTAMLVFHPFKGLAGLGLSVSPQWTECVGTLRVCVLCLSLSLPNR